MKTFNVQTKTVTAVPRKGRGAMAVSTGGSYSPADFSDIYSVLNSKLGIEEFDVMFERVELANGDWYIRAKKSLVSVGELTAYGKGSEDGSGGGVGGSGVNYLRELSDVSIPSPKAGQVLTYDGAKWIAKDVIASGGLDETQLASYLTQNNYAKKSDLIWSNISGKPNRAGSSSDGGAATWGEALRTIDSTNNSRRIKSANMNHSDAALRYYCVGSANIVDGSAAEGHLLHLGWDSPSPSCWSAQLLIPHTSARGIRRRYQASYSSDNWSEWIEILDSKNYTSFINPADFVTLNTEQTITSRKIFHTRAVTVPLYLVTSSDSANYISFYIKDTISTETRGAMAGYYNYFAAIANGISGGAKIGVTDSGIPQYWTDSNGTKRYDLLHSGNYTSFVNPADFVTLDTPQTIKGNKTFTGKIILNTNHYIYGVDETYGSLVYFDGSRTVLGSIGASTTGYTRIRSVNGTAYIYNGSTDYTILHTGNYATTLDGRYVKKSGDTMTGTLNVPRIHLTNGEPDMADIHSSAWGLCFYINHAFTLEMSSGTNRFSPTSVYDNTVNLGWSNGRWANVYSVLGDFSGAVTARRINLPGSASSKAHISSDTGSNLYFSDGLRVLFAMDWSTYAVRPGSAENGTIQFGTSTCRWKNIYSVNANFTDTVTINNPDLKTHLAFGRAGANYITATSSSGAFIFITGGLTPSGANAALTLTATKRVGVCTNSPQAELHVNGDILAEKEVTAYSDVRLKNDIQDLLFKGRLRPRTYIKDGKRSIGFVAQEVLPLYPELIHECNDAMRTLSLNYDGCIPVLAAQLNGVEDRVETVEGRIEALERENKELKEEIKRLKAA